MFVVGRELSSNVWSEMMIRFRDDAACDDDTDNGDGNVEDDLDVDDDDDDDDDDDATS